MSDDSDIEVGPAANETAVRKRVTDAKRRDRIAAEDMEAIMKTPAGRRFMWSLLESTHVMSVSFRHGDPIESVVFREGERNIGLQIVARINRTCPDLYSVMVRENFEVK